VSVASVVLVSQDPLFEEYASALRAAGLACQIVGSVPQLSGFLDRVRSGEGIGGTGQLTAIVDGDLPENGAPEALRLLRSAPNVPTLTLVSGEEHRHIAVDAHRPALDQYASKPVGIGELLLRAKAMMSRSGYDFPSDDEDFSSSGPEGIHHGQVVVLFSPKGGIGKSTLAVNLAVGLTRFFGFKTLLVDADLWFGDVGVLLNVASRRSLLDIPPQEEPSLSILQKLLVQHSSGIHLLLRPPDLASAEKVPTEGVVSAIASYKALFDFVIVDTHPSLDELNLRILDVADRVLVVTTPEITASHHTIRFLDVSGNIGIGNKLALVLNRANSGIRVESIESQLNMPISATVVSAGRAVVQAASHGVSLFDQDPELTTEVTRDLARLVEFVAGRPRPTRGESTDQALAVGVSKEARPAHGRPTRGSR